MSASLPPFVSRHIGPREADIARMLAVVGKAGLDELIDAAIPADIRARDPLDIVPANSEGDVLAQLRGYAAANVVRTSMIGQGYYGTVVPAVIQRNVLESPAWYTAYTPYQPEISQGRLEALVNFQTMVADLTGLDTAGASLLDEATAAAEAMALMHRATKAADDAVLLVDAQVFPQTLAVVRTRATALGLPVVVADLTAVTDADGLRAAAGGGAAYGVVVQYPDAAGEVRDWRALTAAAHDAGALVTAIADLLALTLLAPPGEWGADIAVGTTQRFGVPMMFGGPHAAYICVRSGLERTLPGRLVGVSVDAFGHPAYRLALQTREQHIRREKATSNICTAQVLLAVMASMYAVYHGPEGLTEIAQRVHDRARSLAAALAAGGVEVVSESFFDTLTVRAPGRAEDLVAAALTEGINIGKVDADHVRISTDETTTAGHVEALARALVVTAPHDESPVSVSEPGAPSASEPAAPSIGSWPTDLARKSGFLSHPTFHAYRSETAMLRYLRLLADKDFALDRGMIPLGSCTMKLNATTEMSAVTWPEFADMHPFAPADQSRGYQALIADLESLLAALLRGGCNAHGHQQKQHEGRDHQGQLELLALLRVGRVFGPESRHGAGRDAGRPLLVEQHVQGCTAVHRGRCGGAEVGGHAQGNQRALRGGRHRRRLDGAACRRSGYRTGGAHAASRQRACGS